MAGGPAGQQGVGSQGAPQMAGIGGAAGMGGTNALSIAPSGIGASPITGVTRDQTGMPGFTTQPPQGMMPIRRPLPVPPGTGGPGAPFPPFMKPGMDPRQMREYERNMRDYQKDFQKDMRRGDMPVQQPYPIVQQPGPAVMPSQLPPFYLDYLRSLQGGPQVQPMPPRPQTLPPVGLGLAGLLQGYR